MTESANIRLVTVEDIPRILQLYDELIITTSKVESSKAPLLEDYQRTFSDICSVPGYELLVAEDKGEIVGTMILLIAPNLAHRASPWALVENLTVDPKQRRQQLGRQLIEHAINRAKEAGCYKIILNSNKKRRGAHKFYRSLGFQESSHGFSIYF
jgi:predicted N-acetyltransferase YhbS